MRLRSFVFAVIGLMMYAGTAMGQMTYEINLSAEAQKVSQEAANKVKCNSVDECRRFVVVAVGQHVDTMIEYAAINAQLNNCRKAKPVVVYPSDNPDLLERQTQAAEEQADAARRQADALENIEMWKMLGR
ncbi:MAG: hypothetical protein HQK58_11035 [Deltaproteobacteria bacterium]|nr:hypothetical protein [Deltaproteobacteria bacterium]